MLKWMIDWVRECRIPISALLNFDWLRKWHLSTPSAKCPKKNQWGYCTRTLPHSGNQIELTPAKFLRDAYFWAPCPNFYGMRKNFARLPCEHPLKWTTNWVRAWGIPLPLFTSKWQITMLSVPCQMDIHHNPSETSITQLNEMNWQKQPIRMPCPDTSALEKNSDIDIATYISFYLSRNAYWWALFSQYVSDYPVRNPHPPLTPTPFFNTYN